MTQKEWEETVRKRNKLMSTTMIIGWAIVIVLTVVLVISM